MSAPKSPTATPDQTPKKSRETRTHQVLRSRFELLAQHLEVQDVALRALQRHIKRSREPTTPIASAIPFDASYYNHLSHPVSHHVKILAHSRARLNEYAIIAAYTHFAEYLKGILREMYDHKPFLVVGKAVGQQTLTFPELVELGTYERVAERMVERVFRSLENERSTKKLLERILANTDVAVDPSVQEAALCYLEMRHLFIHGAGIADEKFIADYAQRIALDEKGRLPTTYEVARDAIHAARTLCSHIDAGLLKADLVRPGNPNQRSIKSGTAS